MITIDTDAVNRARLEGQIFRTTTVSLSWRSEPRSPSLQAPSLVVPNECREPINSPASRGCSGCIVLPTFTTLRTMLVESSHFVVVSTARRMPARSSSPWFRPRFPCHYPILEILLSWVTLQSTVQIVCLDRCLYFLSRALSSRHPQLQSTFIRASLCHSSALQ